MRLVIAVLFALGLVTPSLAAQSGPQQVRVVAATANLRQGAGTDQQIVGNVVRGTVLEVMSRSGGWYQVRLSTELGLRAPMAYVHGSLVEPVGGVELQQGNHSSPAPTAHTSPSTRPAAPAYGSAGHPAGYKNPTTAMLIGVLMPGAGQFYTGETKRGALMLGVGLGGLIVGTAMSANSVGVSCDNNFSCEDDTNYLPILLGYGAYLGSWIYGIIDADASAHRMNSRRGLALNGTTLQPVAAVEVGGTTRLGLQVTF